jgi:homoserine kinase
MPPDLVHLPVPDGLSCALLHPHVELETKAARAVLGNAVALRDAVQQWGNVGALVAALFRGDLSLLGRAIDDRVAEPKRAALVPGLAAVKRAAAECGAIGSGLSGAGPSMFALCADRDAAHTVGAAMLDAYRAATAVDGDLWVSRVGAAGARVVTSAR